MKTYAVHVCVDVPERHGKMPRSDRLECTMAEGLAPCGKVATRFIVYRWGAALVCLKHFREEIPTKPRKARR